MSAQGKVHGNGPDQTVVESGGSVDVRTGGQIQANGTQASHIADASTSHALNATFDDTEVEAALDALATKLNSALAALEGAGITASS
ncbi:MAG: hypothetical protein GY906_11595 [bacterium]|nr:hypothetical protein [bacterium]